MKGWSTRLHAVTTIQFPLDVVVRWFVFFLDLTFLKLEAKPYVSLTWEKKMFKNCSPVI